MDEEPARSPTRPGREALGDGFFRFDLPEVADPAAVEIIIQEGLETFQELTASKIQEKRQHERKKVTT